jgi:cytochrome c peroxidase
MKLNRRWLLCSVSLVVACGGGPTVPANETRVVTTPLVASPLMSIAAEVGQSVDLDIRGGFTDRKNQGLTYTAGFSPATTTCLTIANGRITGTPDVQGVIRIKILATDAGGDTVSQSLSVVVFAPGLKAPTLPLALLGYSDARAPIPAHYSLANAPGGSALAQSNMRPDNLTSDAGATLGRVLFYDTRLSANDQISCASCHKQQFGFGDTAKFSTGFLGGSTGRHSMALANARFYGRGRFFWDERAATLEEQALQPIQDPVEMGMTLPDLVEKLKVTPFYPSLFTAAFGTPEITADRVGRAIAQFVRGMVSYGSRFDSTFAPGAPGPDLNRLTQQERDGLQLFNGPAGCAPCHATNAHISDNVHNTGLDATITDDGAGNGRFKAPSLRNVEVRGRFMHDGRFTSLEQVVDFYNAGVQPNPGLDGRLRVPGGAAPRRLNLTVAQRDAIVAYLKTLTDRALMSDIRFSNPF